MGRPPKHLMPSVPALELNYDTIHAPTVGRFHESKAFARVIMGPRGSGKSTGCCWEIFIKALGQEPAPDGFRHTRWLVLRQTYPDLFATTIETWMRNFKSLGEFKQQPLKKFEMRWKEVKCDVIFLALDIPDDAKHLLSMECTGAYVNECREMPKPIIDQLGECVGRHQPVMGVFPSWRGMFMDTNPPDVDHWIYRLAEVEKRQGLLPDWEFFKQPGGLIETSEDEFVPNPRAENIPNLDGGYNYYIRNMQGKSKEHIRVYYCGQYGFVQEGKRVHEEYSDALHTAKKVLVPDSHLPIIVGLDWGLTPAATVWQKQRNGQWWCLDEIATENTDIEVFADRLLGPMLRNKYAGFDIEISGDPGAHRAETDSSTAFTVLKKHGIPARPAPTNEPTARRQALAHAFNRSVNGLPGVQINACCVQLRKGLAGKYYYKRVQVRNEEMYHDKAVKNFWSHVCESAEYALLGAGEGIHRVVSGEDLIGFKPEPVGAYI